MAQVALGLAKIIAGPAGDDVSKNHQNGKRYTNLDATAQAKRCALGVEEVVRKYSLCGAARYSVFLEYLALLFHQEIRRDSSLSMFGRAQVQ